VDSVAGPHNVTYTNVGGNALGQMKTLLILGTLLILAAFTTDRVVEKESNLPGEYTSYSEPVSDMILQRQIILKCDHTVTANYRFDMMNESVSGTWKINGDTLDLVFNTDSEQAGHWDSKTTFLIERNKLILTANRALRQKIRDKELLNKLMTQNKKQNTFKRTSKLKCD